MDENNNVEEVEVVETDVAKKTNSKAITGFILGIVGMFCCFPVGIVGLVFSIIALKEARGTEDGQGKGLAIAGIIIASISILWQLAVIVIFGASLIDVMKNPDAFMPY